MSSWMCATYVNCACPNHKEAWQITLGCETAHAQVTKRRGKWRSDERLRMPTQKKGCDDDEIVGLFSPQRRLFRKSKAAVLFRAKVSYRLMYILHESAMTPTHSSLGILKQNKDVGMGLWMSLCLGVGIFLFPFLFMPWHPYIPLHFIETIFPLVIYSHMPKQKGTNGTKKTKKKWEMRELCVVLRGC